MVAAELHGRHVVALPFVSTGDAGSEFCAVTRHQRGDGGWKPYGTIRQTPTFERIDANSFVVSLRNYQVRARYVVKTGNVSLLSFSTSPHERHLGTKIIRRDGLDILNAVELAIEELDALVRLFEANL